MTRQSYWLGWPGLLEPSKPSPSDRSSSTGASQVSIQSPLSVGLFAGKWCSYSATPDLPHDQREEDGGALVFTSSPLQQTLELLGAVVVELTLSVDRPVAMVAARLSDVRPNDAATRVTYGLLNLTHRDGSEHPRPLQPGQRYPVRIRLNEIGQRFLIGHRLRLSLSTSYWPLAWPPPQSVCLNVETGSSRILLPVREPRASDAQIGFEQAAGATPTRTERLTTPHHNWRVIRDLASDESTLEVINDDGRIYFPEIDLELQRKALEWYRYRGSDLNSATGETFWERGLKRGDWSIRTVTRTILTSTPPHFVLHAQLDAFEHERRVFANTWNEEIERDLV